MNILIHMNILTISIIETNFLEINLKITISLINTEIFQSSKMLKYICCPSKPLTFYHYYQNKNYHLHKTFIENFMN